MKEFLAHRFLKNYIHVIKKVVLKFDIKKASDRLDWNYLKEGLQVMDFND